MNLSQITQAQIYDATKLMRGIFDEMNLGDVGYTEVKHHTLGMVGMVKLPGRPVQEIEGQLKVGYVDAALERALMSPTKLHDYQLHQKVDVSDGEGYSLAKSHTIVHHVRFRTMKRGGLTSKHGEKVETEYDITIPYLRQTVLGEATPVFFLDVFNDIYEIDGERVWAE